MLRGANLILLPSLVLVSGLFVYGDDSQNWKRLEVMPREHRANLAETLTRFDTMPDAERAAVRALDAEIAKLDPMIQHRYRILIQRYLAWTSGLTTVQKTQLDQVGSFDAKIALVDKWRKAEKQANSRAKSLLVLGVHPGDLGTIPPFEMANALKVWLQLDPKERTKIETITPIRAQITQLNRLGNQKNIPKNRFPAVEEAALLKRIEANDEVKNIFVNYYRRLDRDKGETKQAQKQQLQLTNSPLHHLTESLYFMDHPPTPVSLAHLIQFESELPPWFRSSLDPLPPDDARRRLTILYRQIYEAPLEIPPPKKVDPTKPTDATPKSKRPAAKPAAVVPL